MRSAISLFRKTQFKLKAIQAMGLFQKKNPNRGVEDMKFPWALK